MARAADNMGMNTRFKTTIWQAPGITLSIDQFLSLDQEFSRHFDQGGDADAPEPPLYGHLWPSADALARFLWQENIIKPEQKVLEIGCGLGLPSLVAAKAGAKLSCLDHHPGAGELLQRNARQNFGFELSFHLGSFGDAQTRLGTFDLIIGSDILYEPILYDSLVEFLKRHLGEGGELILADPGRFGVPQFCQRVQGLSQHQQRSWQLSSEKHPIDIHCFRWQASQERSQRRQS